MNDDKNQKPKKRTGIAAFFEALKKKEINKDEVEDLEKGDFLAIMIALASYMIPLTIVIVLFFVFLTWIYLN